MTFVRILLLPFSALYGLITGIRNFLFNTGVLKSKEFNTPIICIGNLTVGGTGKTPHTELIITELKKNYRVACLSRGYKRKTKGFILAHENSTASEIGDEPLQIKNKFPDIIVACDEKRVRGIEKLLQLKNKPEVIILDDAFQHRYVKAGRNIVLMDYNRPIYKDLLLPAGRLRENKSALKRADYVIVSKCPVDITPIERRIIFKHLKIKPYQKLFFTTTRYGFIRNIFNDLPLYHTNKKTAVLSVTGIACPQLFLTYLKNHFNQVTELIYPDHHHFNDKDIKQIINEFNNIPSSDKYIITTEKDAVRLRECNIPEGIKNSMFYIPIEPEFINKKEILLKELNEYVSKHKR